MQLLLYMIALDERNSSIKKAKKIYILYPAEEYMIFPLICGLVKAFSIKLEKFEEKYFSF